MSVCILSVRDDRCVNGVATPLFPCYCGDDGELSFGTGIEAMSCVSVTTSGGSRKFLHVAGLPTALQRLGPKSRALVTSFYRAIVERFFIMRAFGDCATRPSFASLFPGVDLDDLAGRNRRRAFGGTFRSTFHKFVNCWYRETAKMRYECGITFYPMTPYVAMNGSWFMANAQDVTDPVLYWDASSDGFSHLRDYNAPTGDQEMGWLYENSMQPDLWVNGQTGGHCRPLLEDVVNDLVKCNYGLAGPWAVGYGFQQWVNRLLTYGDLSRCDGLPTRITTFGGVGGYGSRTLAAMKSATCMAQRFFTCRGNDSTGPAPRTELKQTYNLPALLLAIRMLSVMNAQTVRRDAPASFPHTRITASRELPLGFTFGAGFSVGSEIATFNICTVYCNRIVTCARLNYSNGHAGYKAGDIYYNFGDRDSSKYIPGPCGSSSLNPDYYTIYPNCWMRWGFKVNETGSAQQDEPAYVSFRAIWPNISNGEGGMTFGGRAFPANWAVKEGDVTFGAVTGWLKDTANHKHAWVSVSTTDPKMDLGNCSDLMSVLGRGIFRAGVKRFMCDQGVVRGNTFCGTNFPSTYQTAMREMVGDTSSSNIAEFKCYVDDVNSKSPGGFGSNYDYLKVCSDGTDGSTLVIMGHITGSSLFETVSTGEAIWPDGRSYLRLGSRTAGGIGYDYKRDYDYDSIYGSSEPQLYSYCVRHGWNLDRLSFQFGGHFYGTFIYNNRAARQT